MIFRGNKLTVSVFGESRSEYIGAKAEGLPTSFFIDNSALSKQMLRRSSRFSWSTPRRENDEIEFISGVKDGKVTGNIILRIKNTDAKPDDNSPTVPRPSHADYAAYAKYGAIPSGGGVFSGRMTAPLTAVGAICLQYLREMNIHIGAHIYQIYNIYDSPFDPVNVNKNTMKAVIEKKIPVIDDLAGEKMIDEIMLAKENGDSVGGIVECAVTGLSAGNGNESYGGLDAAISSAAFLIPGIKGVEFGAGFASAGLLGSENNDSFYFSDDKVKTFTNNAGGILGGLSSGMPLIFRVAVKPTPTISKPQKTIDISTKKEIETSFSGRHDSCIVPRVAPVVEAVAAMAVLDSIL